MDPDQTAPVGAVWSGSTMFASVLMLKLTFSDAVILLAFWGLNNVFCVYTVYWGNGARWYSYLSKKPRLIFSFYLCQKLTSPYYTFMRRRLYSKRKVKEYSCKMLYIIAGAVCCVSLLDRLHGDGLTMNKQQLIKWQTHPQILVARYIKQKLNKG